MNQDEKDEPDAQPDVPVENDMDVGDNDAAETAEAEEPTSPTVDSVDSEDTDDTDTDADDGEDEGDGEGEDDDATALPLTSVVEAILFAAREPLKLAHIARAVGKRTRQEAVRAALEELNLHYLETGRAFEIAEISERFQLMSRPEYAANIVRLYPKRETADKEARLSQSGLDTLAIIAYKQPVTRAEIEHIRGVGSGPMLRTLIERGLVKVVGKKADVVGQPLMYGTTDAFLVAFGLGSLDELPMRNEFLSVFADIVGPAGEPAQDDPPTPDEPDAASDGESDEIEQEALEETQADGEEQGEQEPPPSMDDPSGEI